MTKTDLEEVQILGFGCLYASAGCLLMTIAAGAIVGVGVAVVVVVSRAIVGAN